MRSLWPAAAAVALGAGVWGGLTRLGAGIPPLLPHHAAAHGPLMVGGFLGILAGAELATAAGRRWVWLTPALATAAVLWTIVRPEPRPAAWLLTAAAVPVLAAAAERLRRRAGLARAVTALGLLWWLLGNLEWAGLGVLLIAVPCWMTFAVLVVVGRRLELSGETLSRSARAFLIAGLAILFAGLLGAYFDHGLGVRVFGAGCAVIALWGLSADAGSAGAKGADRFTAVCVASGYVWLAAAGTVLAIWGGTLGGLIWDAALHALFLGFVFSMIFAAAGSWTGSASVFGWRLPFSHAFYGHLVLLHLSLLLRIAGDFAGSPATRAAGAILNMVAIAAFLLSTARAAFQGWLSEPSAPGGAPT